MIFVTVGTHEQQFDRLLKQIDNIAFGIQEPCIVQTGYSTYTPQYCEAHKMIPFTLLNEKMEKARIVITHGGPGSIIPVLQMGKVPIVVPRQHKFGEHVNDHQMLFAQKLASENKILPVYDIESLTRYVLEYDAITADMTAQIASATGEFIQKFEELINGMFT